MKFARVFLGYRPQDVESHIAQQRKKQDLLLAEQKQRIDELADENHSLQQQLQKYQAESEAITQCLVQAQQYAQSIKQQADAYAQITALRAQSFYNAWQTYAQTLVASLTDEEVRQFNALKKSAQNVLQNYLKDVLPALSTQLCQIDIGQENPLEKLKNASNASVQQPKQVIDLDELAAPSESLAEICKSLGLGSK